MKKEEELQRDLQEMIKETKLGKLSWKIIGQTSEYNEEKVTVEEDGTKWVVDEVFVSYNCTFKGKEFLIITYEMIHSNGEEEKSNNLVFLPPLGIRVFELEALLNFAVEASNMLIYSIHSLWLTILEAQERYPENISIDMSPRKFEIEDDITQKSLH